MSSTPCGVAGPTSSDDRLRNAHRCTAGGYQRNKISAYKICEINSPTTVFRSSD